jgi:hypothetical protein
MKSFGRSFLLFSCLVAVLPAQKAFFSFHEEFGKESWTGGYLVDVSPSGVELEYHSPYEAHLIRLGPDLDGISWSWVLEDGASTATAQRRGSLLMVEGQLGKKRRDFSQDLGGLPWYQGPDYSLSLLARKEKGAEQGFWIILPKELSVHKMRGKNTGPDSFTLGGEAVSAIRIVLVVQGLPEVIWKNEYWYSPSGEYLGFRGRRGGPWEPLAKIWRVKGKAD